MAKNLYYRVIVQKGGGYHFAKIAVFPDNSWFGNPNDLTLTWQANADEEQKSWYAFTIEITARTPRDLHDCVKIASRAVPRDAGSDTTPEQILEKLERVGTEVVYDSRTSEFTPLADVLPASFKAWRDDQYAMGEKWCMVGCLAESEAEAQDLILLELAKNKYHDYLARWIDAGRPVRCLHDSRAPDVTPARTKLALNGHEEKL